MSSSLAPVALPGELPVHLTKFVGRDRELGDLTPLVESVRLLTLTGAGGSGKTRLAREVASLSTRAFDRMVWVDLVPLSDPEMLADQIRMAMGEPERAETPALRTIVDAVGGSRVLIVLDNCEHLVDACAAVTDAMLRACPNLTVLATSREALGVPAESAWLVPPLGAVEASQLFADRARATLPTFAVTAGNGQSVAEICRRLDGIPLAIELAAARVRVLSPEQIAARLDDAFRLLSSGSRTALPRHRTLRATMEWSFGLLAEREQVLLRRLTVFAGTFTLDAAEAVCAGGLLEVEDILEGVAALVDKSLVVMEAGDGVARYRLLETVRQYGAERLTEADERNATERLHALHFLREIEQAAPSLVGGPAIPGVVPRLTLEYDNIRAAANWATGDESRKELALRFAGSLFWFSYCVGHFRENRQIIDRALGLDGDAPPALRGRALLASGLAALLAQGDYTVARGQLGEALGILVAAGDDEALATARAKYGAAQLLSGDVSAAIATLDEALEIADRGDRGHINAAFARFWRGWAAYGARDLDRAFDLLSTTLLYAREANHPTTIAHTLSTLARIELARGDVDEACGHVADGLELEVANGDAWGLAHAADVIALIAEKRNRHEDALRIVGATEAHRERLSMALPGPAPLEREALVSRVRAALGDRYDAIYTEGRALSTPELVRIALAEATRHTTEHRISVTAEMAVPHVEPRKRLRVSALGPLQVFVGGEPVDASAWGSARPRELLVYLLMHPEGRTKEQVGLAFWPEASASQLRNSFHVTLHRLRRALGGTEWVTLANERYRIDPALIEEFDFAEFEREIADARRAMKRREPGAAAKLDQALRRYRGDLLDGEPVGDWHLEHRDRAQRSYVDALMDTGAAHLADDRPAKAIDAFRRVLARDPLHEDAAQALMRAHVSAGERAQALKVYRRLADALRNELDAEPGASLVELHDAISSSRGA